MKKLIIVLFISSCAVKTPKQLHQERVDACVHRYLDKGVTFLEASGECADRIYKEVKI